MKNKEGILEYLLVQDEEDVMQFILDIDQEMNSWDFTVDTLVKLLKSIEHDIREVPELADSLISEMERFIEVAQ